MSPGMQDREANACAFSRPVNLAGQTSMAIATFGELFPEMALALE